MTRYPTLPMFAAADEADATYQPAEPDPVAAWFAEPRRLVEECACDSCAVVMAFLTARAAAVLPDMPCDVAVAYVIALHRHAVYADETTFAALLDAEPYADRIDAEDTITGDPLQHAPDHGWLEPSTANGTIATERTYKRVDGTVRGHRDVKVCDSAGNVMHAHECLERADMWAMAHGRTMPDLIGTDSSSWHEFVTFQPETLETVAGITFAARPEGAGDSIVGDAKRRRGHKDRTATYPRCKVHKFNPEHMPFTMTYLPWLHFLATGERVVKHYDTRLLVRITPDGRETWTWCGHARTRRTVTIPRATRATGRKIETAQPCTMDDLPMMLAAAYDRPLVPQRYAVTRSDGTTVRVTIDRERRRYCLNIKHADGTTVRRNARTLSAAIKNAQTL